MKSIVWVFLCDGLELRVSISITLDQSRLGKGAPGSAGLRFRVKAIIMVRTKPSDFLMSQS